MTRLKSTAPLDSHDELTTLRVLVAEQAAKLESQEAEVIKRDSVIGLLRAQLELLQQRQHGASSEKIWQFELMLEEIEASRAEAELRSGITPLPELNAAFEKPKRKPLPDGLTTEELVYAAPCNCLICVGTSFLKAAYMTFPKQHLGKASFNKPDRTPQRRDQETNRRRRHLSQR